MLDIVPSCNPVQYQGKLMIQSWQYGKKPNIGPPELFSWVLSLLPSYHPTQFQGKRMNQTWENGKKTNFGPDFGWFGPQNLLSWVLPLLDVRHCCKLSSSSISWKTYDPNPRKWQKTSFWAWFRPVWPKCGSQNFFYKTSN